MAKLNAHHDLAAHGGGARRRTGTRSTGTASCWASACRVYPTGRKVYVVQTRAGREERQAGDGRAPRRHHGGRGAPPGGAHHLPDQGRRGPRPRAAGGEAGERTDGGGPGGDVSRRGGRGASQAGLGLFLSRHDREARFCRRWGGSGRCRWTMRRCRRSITGLSQRRRRRPTGRSRCCSGSTGRPRNGS